MKSGRLSRARPAETNRPNESTPPAVGRTAIGYVPPANRPPAYNQTPPPQPQYGGGYQQPPQYGGYPQTQPNPYQYGNYPPASPSYPSYVPPVANAPYIPQQMPGQQMPGQQMPGQHMPGQQMPGQSRKFTIEEVVQVTDQRLIDLENFRKMVEDMLQTVTPESFGLFMMVMEEVQKRQMTQNQQPSSSSSSSSSEQQQQQSFDQQQQQSN